jgi:hypothetical protein
MRATAPASHSRSALSCSPSTSAGTMRSVISPCCAVKGLEQNSGGAERLARDRLSQEIAALPSLGALSWWEGRA